jgi:hypothetical protein
MHELARSRQAFKKANVEITKRLKNRPQQFDRLISLVAKEAAVDPEDVHATLLKMFQTGEVELDSDLVLHAS